MTPRVVALVEQLHAIQSALQHDLSGQAERWRFRPRHRSVEFPEDVRRTQRSFKVGLATFLARTRPVQVLIAPVVYSLTLPLVLLDLWATLFQWICFPVWKVPRVRRRDYLVLDHRQLAYLNLIEKTNCLYCSYANGTIAYAREVAARTEQYWCPIKHAKPFVGAHDRSHQFVEYGDAGGYRTELHAIRRAWSDVTKPPA